MSRPLILFDIHDVLISYRAHTQFRTYLEQQALHDEMISLDWQGDVSALMNGLCYKHCPLCDFAQCRMAGPHASAPHLLQAVYDETVSYEALKVGLTQMLTHYIQCPKSVRIILDYYALYLSQPSIHAAYTQQIPEGVALFKKACELVGKDAVYCFSYAPVALLEQYTIVHDNLFGAFSNKQFLSSNWFGSKADYRTYEACAAHLGIYPAECMFIDDNAVNIEAAKKAGMHVLGFLPSQEHQLEKALETFIRR